MLNAEMLRGGAGNLRLVVFFFGETDGKRLHLFSQAPNEPREERIGIKPTAQEQTEWNVAP